MDLKTFNKLLVSISSRAKQMPKWKVDSIRAWEAQARKKK